VLTDWVYRHDLGWVFGRRMLRLTHWGRNSGRRYTTVLEVVSSDPSLYRFVVIAGFGPQTDWLRNIEAGNPVEITVGRATFAAHARRLSPEEAFRVLTDYELRNRLITPLVRRGLSWLAGWRYDSTSRARHQLIEQLPVIMFWPAHPDSGSNF
jgi:deazaflavin-dependent oxidoreductase (nitroreductase family)